MFDMRCSLRNKVISWVLSLALVIALLPESAFASTDEEENIPTADIPSYEVIDKTSSMTTLSMEDDTYVSIFHGRQVRFEDEDGNLVDYDPSLVCIEEGEVTIQDNSLQGYTYQNEAGDKKHYLPFCVQEDTPLRMEYEEKSIEFSMTDDSLRDLGIKGEEGSLETKEVQGIYEDRVLLPVDAVYGSDEGTGSLTYTSSENGIKETLVLSSRPSTNVFTYTLKLTGMYARKNIYDEGITYYDKESDEIAGFISPPYMNDSTENAYSEDITYDLIQGETEGEYILAMTIDEDYLSDPAREYPVTIDPTHTWQGSSSILDAYVISGSTYGNVNFYDSSVKKMPAGRTSVGTHRTYMKFNGLKTEINDKSVTSAKLTIYQSTDCDGGQSVGAYRVTESWSPSTLTYNNRPASGVCYDTITTTTTDYGAKVLDLTTYARNVASGDIQNYGIQLYNKTTNPEFACFLGSRASSYRPKLVVTYCDKPKGPTKLTLKRYLGGYEEASHFQQGKTVYAAWEGIQTNILSQVQYKVVAADDTTPSPTSVSSDNINLTTYRPMGSATVSATNRICGYTKYLPEGKYRLYLRAKDSNGCFGPAISKIFYVDGTSPVLENVTITPDAQATYTDNQRPTISFSARDKYFDKVELSLDGSIIKTFASSGDHSYQIPEGKINQSKEYEIKIKAVDKAGNVNAISMPYLVDKDHPSGSLQPKALGTGEDTNILLGAATIKVEIADEGSGIRTSSLSIYPLHGENIIPSEEIIIDTNQTISRNAVLDTLTRGQGASPLDNGPYRLVLRVEDMAGHESTITKDVTIENSFVRPAVSLVQTMLGQGMIHWSFPSSTEVFKLQYSIDNGSWTDVQVTLGATEGNDLIDLCDGPGEHKLKVRGVNRAGAVSEETEIYFLTDVVSPVVNITSFEGGYLKGSVNDANLASGVR